MHDLYARYKLMLGVECNKWFDVILRSTYIVCVIMNSEEEGPHVYAKINK